MDGDKKRYCDECDQNKKFILFCSICAQSLCIECDKRIHSKGSRKQHIRTIKDNDFNFYNSDSFCIIFFSKQAENDNITPKNSIKSFFKTYLVERANRGILTISVQDLKSFFLQKFNLSGKQSEEFIHKEVAAKTFQLRSAIYDKEGEKYLVSLTLSSVSVESIVWVIRSIRNDLMQPTDCLIKSRLKECFGLKISCKEWRTFVHDLKTDFSLLDKMNKFKEQFGEIFIGEEVEGNTLLLLKDENWVYEDSVTIDSNCEMFTCFLSFIEMYLNSNVEGISGGKYGCAMLAKSLGPALLKTLSLGRIFGFVNLAIKQQIIVHNKVYIVLNKNKCSIQKNQMDSLSNLQQQVINLLIQSPSQGVALAQLQTLFYNKYNTQIEFGRYGFLKLKEFLKTMEDRVILEIVERDQVKVILRQKFLNPDELLKTSTQSLRQISPESIPQNFEFFNYTVDHFIGNSKARIMNILTQNKGEVEVGRLEKLFEEQTKRVFNPPSFNVENFLDFILTYFQNAIKVVISRDKLTGKKIMLAQILFQCFPNTKTPLNDIVSSFNPLNYYQNRNNSECQGFEFQVISPICSSMTMDALLVAQEDQTNESIEPLFDFESLRRFNKLLDPQDD